ncbi:MAG: hypothetical protein AAGH68_12890, partial [Pseudomonadota bacterium]
EAVETAARLAQEQRAAGARLDPLQHMTARLVGEGHKVPDPLVQAGLQPPVSLPPAPPPDEVPTVSGTAARTPVPNPLDDLPAYARPIEQATTEFAQEFHSENVPGMSDAAWTGYMDDLIPSDFAVAPEAFASTPTGRTAEATSPLGPASRGGPAATQPSDQAPQPASATTHDPRLAARLVQPLAAAPALPTGIVGASNPAPLSSRVQLNLSRLIFNNPGLSSAQIVCLASATTGQGGLGRPGLEQQVADLGPSTWYQNIIRHRQG